MDSLLAIVIVYSFHARLAPVPPDAVLPMDARTRHVPAGYDRLEVSLEHGDVICVEKNGSSECAMAVFDKGWPSSGLTVSVAAGTRFVVLSCSGGVRFGVAVKDLPLLPPDNAIRKMFSVATSRPTPGRCWWDAWCAIWRGQ